MRSRKPLVLAITLVLLLPTLAGAATETKMPEEETTLTGALSQSSDEHFYLTDPDSEVEVQLRGSEEELADHVGSNVVVSGSWAEDDEGSVYFEVTAVETAAA